MTVLLSVYMTMLALMPCQDQDDQVANTFDTTVSKSNACNNRPDQESCPPFCTCNCCSTARYIPAQPLTVPIIAEVVNTYAPYKMPFVQQQSVDIWLPPQIA